MLITRATRRDLDRVLEFYRDLDWFRGYREPDLTRGSVFLARKGAIVGAIRVIDLEPTTLVLEDVLVHPDHRGKGVGRDLIATALNSRGGKVFLCCHPEAIGFYETIGFAEIPFESQPDVVRAHWIEDGTWPVAPDHVHHFMTAR